MDTLINPVPANDEYFLAHTLDATPSTRLQTTNGATVQSGEPVPACAALGETVWFVIPPGPAAEVTISTSGSNFDTAMALWREVPEEAFLEQAGCNDDAELPNGEIVPTSSITTTLEAGVLYRVQVGSAMAQTGDLILTVVANGTCDVNADGFGDVLLGTPLEAVDTHDEAGAVTVVLGGADDEQIRQKALHQNSLNVFGRAESGDHFGGATTCVDVDGDGVDDMVVGSPGEGIGSRSGAGAIHILFGGVETFGDRSIYLSQSSGRVPGNSETGDLFGASLASGDLNGDGLGRPGDSAGVHGRAEANDRFGATVAVADLDGDGYDDLIVGAPGEAVGSIAGVGMVTILRGGEAGLTPADSILGIGNAPDQLFGSSLATTDLDGDGVRRTGGPAPGAVVGTLTGSGFGTAVAVGDVDADGIDELFVAAPAIGSVSFQIGSTVQEVLLVDVAGQLALSELPVDFGSELTVQDMTGDGRGDLVVRATHPTTGEPMLVMLPGSPTGPELGGARLLGSWSAELRDCGSSSSLEALIRVRPQPWPARPLRGRRAQS
ncbi:Integrin alpha-PS5 [Nymphon striatum]|nr:Integrin alpha-PS5 [Nymphon striatum]